MVPDQAGQNQPRPRRTGPKRRRATLAATPPDVTEARAATLWQGAFESTPMPVICVDAGGVIVGLNPAAVQVMGRDRAAWLGQPAAALLPPALVQALERSGASGQAQTRRCVRLETPGLATPVPGCWDGLATPVYEAGTGVLVGTVLTLADVAPHAQAQSALVADLCRAEARARRRLARALHDQAAQTQAAAKLRLQMLGSHLHEPTLQAPYQQTLALVTQLGHELRALTAELSLSADAPGGLGAALQELARQVTRRAGIPVECALDGNEDTIPAAQADVLFQAVREILADTDRPAAAGRIALRLQIESGEVRLHLAVTGATLGLNPPEAATAPGSDAGLEALRRRLASLGGRLDARDLPGSAQSVILSLPTAAPPTA